MNNEKAQRNSEIRLSPRGRRVRDALVAVAAVAATGVVGVAVHDGLTTDFEGNKKVELDSGDTLSNITNTEVRGGASHTQDVVNEIVRRNPDVFENGKPFIGSEDLGQSIDVPEKAE